MSQIRTIANELSRMFPLKWDMRRRYRVPSAEPGQQYFIEWDASPYPIGEGWVSATFDERGVLISSLGLHIPVTIAQFAFHEYARYVETGNGDVKKRFLDQAEFFVRSQRGDGAYTQAETVPDYRATPGWISGMAQGEAASVLLRAHVLTGDERFKAAGIRGE